MTDWHRKLSKLQLTLIGAHCCLIFAWSVQNPTMFKMFFVLIGLPGMTIISLADRANIFDILRCYIAGGLGALVAFPIAFPFSLHIVFISAFVGWVLAVIFNQGLRHRRSLPEQTTDPEAPNMDGEGNEQLSLHSIMRDNN
ncbi:hypothetical protein [Rhodopirellula bahusiensis]|nr:hypothetical protein [Rhodopirellula bahusiensis]